MIEIQELEGKVMSEIIDMILEQKSTSFEIYIPKSSVMFFSERREIAIEYNKLAYAGHLLKELSISFNYKEVKPEDLESVLFNVETTDIEGLAKVLFEISFGYVNDEEDDIYENLDTDINIMFDMNADQYLADVRDGKIKPACNFFCEIAEEFFKEDESPDIPTLRIVK